MQARGKETLTVTSACKRSSEHLFSLRGRLSPGQSTVDLNRYFQTIIQGHNRNNRGQKKLSSEVGGIPWQPTPTGVLEVYFWGLLFGVLVCCLGFVCLFLGWFHLFVFIFRSSHPYLQQMAFPLAD